MFHKLFQGDERPAVERRSALTVYLGFNRSDGYHGLVFHDNNNFLFRKGKKWERISSEIFTYLWIENFLRWNNKLSGYTVFYNFIDRKSSDFALDISRSFTAYENLMPIISLKTEQTKLLNTPYTNCTPGFASRAAHSVFLPQSLYCQ